MNWGRVLTAVLVELCLSASRVTAEVQQGLPHKPEYYPVDTYIAHPNRAYHLETEDMSFDGLQVSIELPDCWLPEKDLEQTRILRYHLNNPAKYDILPVTINGRSVVGHTKRKSGLFALAAPIRLLDTRPPVVMLQYKEKEIEGNGAYVNSHEKIELLAGDLADCDYAVSGIGGVYVLFDTKPSYKYTKLKQKLTAPFGSARNSFYHGPFSVPEGAHVVYAFALDKAGNGPAGKTMLILSDGTPPVDTLKVDGAALASGATVHVGTSSVFEIAAVDPEVKRVSSGVASQSAYVSYQDGSCGEDIALEIPGVGNCDEHKYAGAFHLPEGEYSVHYYSEDKVGNVSVESVINAIVSGGNVKN